MAPADCCIEPCEVTNNGVRLGRRTECLKSEEKPLRASPVGGREETVRMSVRCVGEGEGEGIYVCVCVPYLAARGERRT